jgi:hypothetical protein
MTDAYSARLLMMDTEPVRNMCSSIPKINLRISASCWFYYKNISRCTVLWMSNCIFTFLYFLGYQALYSGLQPTLVRTIPATATLFLLYETTKKVLHKLCDWQLLKLLSHWELYKVSYLVYIILTATLESSPQHIWQIPVTPMWCWIVIYHIYFHNYLYVIHKRILLKQN